ncbi:hypothetical protein AN641_01255 [Candidatus Epulonipiscioides gigas]|nr:hypothetical protein AN641_01255 [Epulopiscium sp. SCG-C07WGA-EpuloA2]
MLKIQDISISYNNHIIVDKFNLEVNQGEIVSIVGESGSGKTSIIRSILRLLPTSAQILDGDILYNNTSLLNLSDIELNKLKGEEIALVFQDSGLSLNPIRKIGKQFIQYIQTHRAYTKQDAYILARDTLTKMNLDGNAIMNSYIFNLSGGMKQRVGIAFALALRPKLLLLDEPTSALDVKTQKQVIDELLQLQNEFSTAILMITHNISLAHRMSNKIIVLQNGKIMDFNDDYTNRLFGDLNKCMSTQINI